MGLGAVDISRLLPSRITSFASACHTGNMARAWKVHLKCILKGVCWFCSKFEGKQNSYMMY